MSREDGPTDRSGADRAIDFDGLRAYLAAEELQYAILFGSVASGSAGEESDVDIALRFPDDWDRRDRFRQRNRIDADVQRYADVFVDVSDVQALPDEVAVNALREGRLLCGDESGVESDLSRLEQTVAVSNERRRRERREFVDRLAEGDV